MDPWSLLGVILMYTVLRNILSTLTMDHYTHIGLHDLNAALESLSDLSQTNLDAMKAMGTDDGKSVVAAVGDISCNSVRTIKTRDNSKVDLQTNDAHMGTPPRNAGV